MSNKFDELAKELAQSVTRRQALKRFGVCLTGIALACFGLANNAEARACSDTPCFKKCVKTCLENGESLAECGPGCGAVCGCI